MHILVYNSLIYGICSLSVSRYHLLFGSYEKLLMYAAVNVSAAFDGGVDAI